MLRALKAIPSAQFPSMVKCIRFVFLLAIIQCFGCFNIRRSAISIAEIGNTSYWNVKSVITNFNIYNYSETEVTFYARFHGRDSLIHFYLSHDYGLTAGDKYYIRYDTINPHSYRILLFQPVLNYHFKIDTSIAIITTEYKLKTGEWQEMAYVGLKFQTKDSAKWVNTGTRVYGLHHSLNSVRVIYERENPKKLYIMFPNHSNKFATD